MRENTTCNNRTLRWTLSVLLLVAGLGAVWVWGRVATPSGSAPAAAVQPRTAVLYAAWQPVAGARPSLFRSVDRGESWQPVALDMGQAAMVAWASDGADRVAVALSDGTLLRSGNRGARWTKLSSGPIALSLVFGSEGRLFIGTQGQGIWLQESNADPQPLAAAREDLSAASVRHLALAGGRLFAATSDALFVSDDNGATFAPGRPVPGRVSAMAAVDARTLLVGTEGSGVLRSSDGGLGWQPAAEGLGQAAGLVLSITALQADASEPGVLYASVSYLVGGTELHEAPAGTFMTLDGGASWVHLTGPSFPEAQRASALVLVPSRPGTVLAATTGGLQSYKPDPDAALTALERGTASERANAARLLGLSRAAGSTGPLIAALADPDNTVAQAAAEALGSLADRAAVPELISSLAGSDSQLQRNAARALGLLRAESAVEPLSRLLAQGDPATAGAAAEALRQVGSSSAVRSLLLALADEELTPRRHASMAALESLGEPAVQPLVSMLSDEGVASRRNAAEALGWIGSPSATRALVASLDDDQASVRSEAAWALGEISDPSAQRALARVRSGDVSPEVRQSAGLALEKLADRPHVPTQRGSLWASALSRAEAVRWLLLGLAVVGAALLVARDLRHSPAQVAPCGPSVQVKRSRSSHSRS